MKKIFEETIDILREALNSIDPKALEALILDCIKTLESGHKIICSGLGKNVPVCDKFVGTMNSLGLDACFMNTNSAVHGDLGMVKDGDLVIIMTKSGATSESIYLHQLLNERKCQQWLLSFEKDSVLGCRMPHQIIVSLRHEGDMWNIVPNHSTTINLIVLQTIALQIAEKMQISLPDFKRNHPGGHIGEVLKDV